MNKLMNEMESQKELLLTYEQTLSHKDSIVANITNAIQKQVWCFVFIFISLLNSFCWWLLTTYIVIEREKWAVEGFHGVENPALWREERGNSSYSYMVGL